MNRESRVDVYTYNIQAGLEGKIPGTDWTWEVYGSKGESQTSALTTGVASLERFRTMIASPNWGEGFTVTAGQPAFGGFGAIRDLHERHRSVPQESTISKDCIDAIRPTSRPARSCSKHLRSQRAG